MAEFEIIYGKGISRAGELLDLGELAGIVQRSGSWYSYDGDRLGQGRENSRKFLNENLDVADVIDAKLRVEYGLVPSAEAVAGDDGSQEGADDEMPSEKSAPEAS